jgi:hypothetical protein
VFQIVDLSSINDLKFTSISNFKKIFPGVIPLDPYDKGEGRGGEEREGWDGVNPPENESWLRPCFGMNNGDYTARAIQVVFVRPLPNRSV